MYIGRRVSQSAVEERTVQKGLSYDDPCECSLRSSSVPLNNEGPGACLGEPGGKKSAPNLPQEAGSIYSLDMSDVRHTVCSRPSVCSPPNLEAILGKRTITQLTTNQDWEKCTHGLRAHTHADRQENVQADESVHPQTRSHTKGSLAGL